MDVHHVGQLLDAPFAESVAFYERLGLSLRETTGGRSDSAHRDSRGSAPLTTDGPVRVAFFETESAEFHLVVREARGSPADALLDAIGRYSAAHVAFEVDDIEAAMADARELGLSFLGDAPESGLGPYRRAFVAPEGHVGIPFELVEPR